MAMTMAMIFTFMMWMSIGRLLRCRKGLNDGSGVGRQRTAGGGSSWSAGNYIICVRQYVVLQQTVIVISIERILMFGHVDAMVTDRAEVSAAAADTAMDMMVHWLQSRWHGVQWHSYLNVWRCGKTGRGQDGPQWRRESYSNGGHRRSGGGGGWPPPSGGWGGAMSFIFVVWMCWKARVVWGVEQGKGRWEWNNNNDGRQWAAGDDGSWSAHNGVCFHRFVIAIRLVTIPCDFFGSPRYILHT